MFKKHKTAREPARPASTATRVSRTSFRGSSRKKAKIERCDGSRPSFVVDRSIRALRDPASTDGVLSTSSLLAWDDLLARLLFALHDEGFVLWAALEMRDMSPLSTLAGPMRNLLVIVTHPQASRVALAVDAADAVRLPLEIALRPQRDGEVLIEMTDPICRLGRSPHLGAKALAEDLLARLRRVAMCVG